MTEYKEKNFCLIRLSKQIVFKDIITVKSDNVLNLIDKDKGIDDLINIFSNSYYIVTRNSGLCHLVEILNINMIHINWFSNGIENIKNVIRKKKYYINNYKDLHKLYINEDWTPISTNQIRLIEYSKFDNKYNLKFYSILSDIINSL